MTLSPAALQRQAVWNDPLPNADPRSHRNATYAATRLVAAFGEFANWSMWRSLNGAQACADMAICLCRVANTLPDGGVDLDNAVQRLRRKRNNAWTLHHKLPPSVAACVFLAESIGAVMALISALNRGEAWSAEDARLALGHTWIDIDNAADTIPREPLGLAVIIDTRVAALRAEPLQPTPEAP